MNAGRVTGRVWATRKDASLEGRRLLLVQPLNFRGAVVGSELVALDRVDAGVGDRVIYVSSSEAAIPFRPGLTATDATIVGILERVDHVDGSW